MAKASKAAPGKSAVKKLAIKKTSSQKDTMKKADPKKIGPKKTSNTSVKRVVDKKAVPKKSAAKKAPPKKAITAKPGTVKKKPAKQVSFVPEPVQPVKQAQLTDLGTGTEATNTSAPVPEELKGTPDPYKIDEKLPKGKLSHKPTGKHNTMMK